MRAKRRLKKTLLYVPSYVLCFSLQHTQSGIACHLGLKLLLGLVASFKTRLMVSTCQLEYNKHCGISVTVDKEPHELMFKPNKNQGVYFSL